MDRKRIRGNLILLLVAMIWGSSFVAQSVGMDSIGPLTFNGIRTLLGGIVLLPLVVWINARKPNPSPDHPTESARDLWIGGICCGLFLCIASNFQQFGLLDTTAGKSGFITALYVVLVPVFGLFLKKRAPFTVWIGVLLAVAGLYLLCITESFSIGKGDFLTMICALFYSFHILVIDHFSKKANGVKLSCIQFFVSAFLSLALMFIFESPDLSQILKAAWPLSYSGIMSCGVAYTLQIVGQKDTDPTVASLIMCLESVFAVISGWLFLHETLSLREGIGCVLMFAAILLSQIPPKKKKVSQ